MSSNATELNNAKRKNTFNKIWWNVKWVPVKAQIELAARKAAKNSKAMNELKKKCFGEDAVDETKEKLSPEETIKEAEKMHKENDTSDVSTSIIKNADQYKDVLTQQKIIERGINTQKLINYAFFFMQNEKASLIKRPQVEKEIINGIAALCGFPKIYESAGVSSLKQYDIDNPEEFLETSKFILSICDIKRKLSDPCFMEKVKERIQNINLESEFPQDDPPEEDDGTIMKVVDGKVEIINPEATTAAKDETKSFWKVDKDQKVIKPIFFRNEGKEDFDYDASITSLPVKGTGITDEMFENLEKAFGFCKYKRRYELMPGGLVKMFLYKGNGVEEYFLIDPNIVMGCGKYYVLCKIPNNDTIFVSCENQDILNKVFDNPFYILTPDEIQKVIYKYFRNMNIYKYLDMSYTDEMGELSDEDFQKLGKKITYILSQVMNQSNGVDLPRFRINYWNGIDDFLMISDPSVISPMAYDGTTSSTICEGLMYEVKGDDIIQRFMGTEITFHIDKYGDM